jgi:hypothetical protein
MAGAPTAQRLVPPRELSNWDVCEGYGFKFGTDAFGFCLQHRDKGRERAALELIRASTPVVVPSVSCQSTSFGHVTTAQCNCGGPRGPSNRPRLSGRPFGPRQMSFPGVDSADPSQPDLPRVGADRINQQRKASTSSGVDLAGQGVDPADRGRR